ncbi:GNAT family N-acetyltransferase [Micromonospora sp. NPDC048868]|uniref:GNAT family N-acetyltransferase n=1 Tax=Micromonospora sp. NPDC048868 TaxID=3364258 RepID=UPI0037116F30
MTRLITPRTLLRQWRDDDVDAMTAVNSDPEVMRWIGDGSPLDRERTVARLAYYRQHWDRHGFGLFALTLRESDEVVGFVGLAVPDFLPEVLPAVEIGWRLARRHWGRGLATEAACAVLAHARDDLGLTRLVSIHQVGNDASARVMRRLGMRLDRTTTDPSAGRPVRVYAIDLDEPAAGGTRCP